MIKAVNNVNFKAVYTSKSAKFSDSQQRVFDDIINKFCLDEKAKNLTLEDEIQYVEEIFNSSLKAGVSDNYIKSNR